MIPKYPRTPYLPFSPSIPPGNRTVSSFDHLVGVDLVITEKVDGGNTLLHEGSVYARSTGGVATAPWFGMVKKHHAWRVRGFDVFLYGEDIYGVHSIEYAPVPEDRTFYAFALRRFEEGVQDAFEGWDSLRSFCEAQGLPVVPAVCRGTFSSVGELQEFMLSEHCRPSLLGGEREGLVARVARSFPACDFEYSVAKSVRADHVQTGEHWSRNWRPCRLV